MIKNFKLKILRLIFQSDTNPVKVFVAISSLLYSAFALYCTPKEGVPVLLGHEIFLTLMFLYGVGRIWRMFDDEHRQYYSITLSIVGALLWISTAWQEIYEFIQINNKVYDDDIAAISTIALASCWLLIRCGSGETLAKDKCTC